MIRVAALRNACRQIEAFQQALWAKNGREQVQQILAPEAAVSASLR